MKPRRWYQLHLTTCILLMLTAGILLGVNLKDNGHFNFIMLGISSPPFNQQKQVGMLLHYGTTTNGKGWPTLAYEYYKVAGANYGWWHTKGLIVNTTSALFILICVAIISEFIARRPIKFRIPSRPSFQLHFFTIILLFLIAGALVGLNITQHDFRLGTDYLRKEEGSNLKADYGWPWKCAYSNFDKIHITQIQHVIQNVASALIILLIVAIISESVRRRPKPTPAREILK